MAFSRPRILLTGKNGQVGWELQRTLAPLGEVVALDRQQLDLANPDQIRERVREIKPKLIVNAAAYTAVDKAEEEPELAMAINGLAPGILAEEAKRLNAAIVHYSTDYVFDGTQNAPYTEEDQPNPLNVYGKTKLEGERAIQTVGVPHLILRTSWAYGLRGKNFLLTILRLAKERNELRVVDDQIGAPTWSRMIAEVTGSILAKEGTAVFEQRDVYHISAHGQTSWYGFAKAILKLTQEFMPDTSNFKAHLEPISSAEFVAQAQRPRYSKLDSTKIERTWGASLPFWEDTLKMALTSDKI